jgi:hypothetical protein
MNIFSKRVNTGQRGLIAVMLLFICFLILLSAPTQRPEPKVTFIPNPSPTHVEKDYKELVEAGMIPYKVNDEITISLGLLLVGDRDGNIFILDRGERIIKFDKDHKFIKTFGKAGDGPGEFRPTPGYNEIWASSKGNIYISDVNGEKMITFDNDGNHTGDLVFPASGKFPVGGGFVPAVTSDGYLYVRNTMGCTLDVCNINDKPLRLHTRLLGKEDCEPCLFERNFGDMEKDLWSRFNPRKTFYDLFAGDRLLVYLAQASTAYIFDKHNLVKKFDLRPKDALELYRRKIEAAAKYGSGGIPDDTMLFTNFFVDKDNDNLFYLECRVDKDQNTPKRMLYKFNVDGELLGVLYVTERVQFRGKLNHRFYAISKEGIRIYKEADTKSGLEKQ